MTKERHSDPNKGGSDQYKRHVDGSVRVSGQIEVHPPPDFVEEDKADRKDQKTHRNKNFVVSVLTLIGVIIYAGLTYWMGHMTRESINNNTRQFQIDQRPYLWWNNVAPETSIQAGEKMWANIQLINYGKAPALKMQAKGKIFIGPDASKDADEWFEVSEIDLLLIRARVRPLFLQESPPALCHSHQKTLRLSLQGNHNSRP